MLSLSWFRAHQLKRLRSSTNVIGLRRATEDWSEVSVGLIRSKWARGYSNYSGIKGFREGRVVSDKGYHQRQCHATRRFLQQSRLELANSKIFPGRRSKDRSPLALLPLWAFISGWNLLKICGRALPQDFVLSSRLCEPNWEPVHSAWWDCGGNCCPISPRHAPSSVLVYSYTCVQRKYWSMTPPNFPDLLITIKRTRIETR